MATWFECKVKYDKMSENGMPKAVTEPYLVDALSFTEAEARITEEITPFISGDYKVTAVKRTNTAEIFSYDKSAPEIVETHLIHLKNKVSNVSINSLSIFNNFSDNKTKELSVSYINSEKEIKAEILKLSTEK